MEQVGIPLFYLQGMGGGAVLKFRDLFNDSDRFWAWREYLGATPSGKSGWEANGQYVLQVNNAINGCWDSSYSEASKIFIAPIAFPLEVITRLDDIGTINNETQSGLFIAKSGVNFGANMYLAVCRKRDDAQGKNGICVVQDYWTNLAFNSVQTLPVWFRLRIGCVAYGSIHVLFDYSLDGVNWIEMYEQSSGFQIFSYGEVCIGLYAGNGSSTKLAITAKFDHFLMKPKTIN